MDSLGKANLMLDSYPLCDHCLGRQFAFLGYGLENKQRGRALKTILTMKGHKLALSKDSRGITLLKLLVKNGFFIMAEDILRKLKRRVKYGEKCYLCEGHFEDLQSLIKKVVFKLQDYEYETFLVGIKLPAIVEEKEDEFKAKFKVEYGESLKNEYSRLIGKMISEATNKSVNFKNPNIVILVNPFSEWVKLQVNSLFIMGRYRKLLRGIPQSKWYCPKCRGKGCNYCEETGKIYTESVEELIASPVLDKTFGEGSSFHGAGREDTDARMLGLGRPFIIQIKRPSKRRLDLIDLEKEINERAEGKIEVRNLKFVDRNMIIKLKQLESSQKIYRVTVQFERTVSEKEIEKLQDSLSTATINQRTPNRVLHRRADLNREKQIYETKIKRISPSSIEMKIRCQGGLYIKELVTGDEGRTNPNVTNIINVLAKPLNLDVMNLSVKGGKL